MFEEKGPVLRRITTFKSEVFKKTNLCEMPSVACVMHGAK